MDEGNSCPIILGLKIDEFDMKIRNNPVKIGVVLFYEPYKGEQREFIIPENVRKTFNKVAVSNNIVYMNGFRLNTETGEWSRTIKSTIINFFL